MTKTTNPSDNTAIPCHSAGEAFFYAYPGKAGRQWADLPTHRQAFWEREAEREMKIESEYAPAIRRLMQEAIDAS